MLAEVHEELPAVYEVHDQTQRRARLKGVVELNNEGMVDTTHQQHISNTLATHCFLTTIP